MRRARRQAYYKAAHFVRQRRRRALALRLALSTQPGEPNRAGVPGGVAPSAPGPNTVYLTQDVAYRVEIPQGSRIVYYPRIKLFDVDRSYFQIPGTDFALTAR